MRSNAANSPGSGYASARTALSATVIPDSPAGLERPEQPIPDTARAREAAVAAQAQANGLETRGARLRRGAHQGRLQGYALATVALIAVLVVLAATNTARVHVDWLVGSSRVSLVWLVLAAAIVGWILGVLASVRFQWLTRRRPHRVQPKTSSTKRWRV